MINIILLIIIAIICNSITNLINKNGYSGFYIDLIYIFAKLGFPLIIIFIIIEIIRWII